MFIFISRYANLVILYNEPHFIFASENQEVFVGWGLRYCDPFCGVRAPLLNRKIIARRIDVRYRLFFLLCDLMGLYKRAFAMFHVEQAICVFRYDFVCHFIDCRATGVILKCVLLGLCCLRTAFL